MTHPLHDTDLRQCIGKKKHRTFAQAEEIRKRWEEARGVPLRVYHCVFCRRYHLTKDQDRVAVDEQQGAQQTSHLIPPQALDVLRAVERAEIACGVSPTLEQVAVACPGREIEELRSELLRLQRKARVREYRGTWWLLTPGRDILRRHAS